MQKVSIQIIKNPTTGTNKRTNTETPMTFSQGD